MFNPEEIAERSPNVARARQVISGWSLSRLRVEAAERNGRFFLSETIQSSPEAASLWLVHQELSSRGVAPRFRRVPPLRSATYLKGKLWVDITPTPVANALQMSRAIDLQWVLSQRDGTGNLAVQRLCKDGVTGPTARAAMQSGESRAKLALRFDLSLEEQLQLTALVGRDVIVLRRAGENRITRRHRLIETYSGDRYRLPEADVAVRKEWAIAVEYASLVQHDPSGEAIVQWMWRVTGRQYSRQAANKARRVLLSLSELPK